ncbi:MAG: shikimate dehydrogenase [Eubacterium sp.]|nr:shikimate dehydrogenase [Eubacterium sp.]
MKYGLIGEKLSHSYSKIIHEKLADYTYDLCPLTKKEFPVFMEQREFSAINVTIPYKCDVIPYLESMDESAAAIGAVNTIVNRDGKLYGYNTDLPGFIYMAEKNGISMEGKKVVVLGNGGAAQAIKAGIKKLGAASMIVVGHRVMKEGVITYEECFEKHADADIIVNTSPVGMYPASDASPVDLTRFPQCEAVLDIIYNPLTTKLVAQARELGMTGVTGLEMLVAQAKYAVEIFLDTKLDERVIDDIYRELAAQLS